MVIVSLFNRLCDNAVSAFIFKLRPLARLIGLGIAGLVASPTAAPANPPALITNIALTNGSARLTILSTLGLTNEVQRVAEMGQTNWIAITNLVVTQSPYFVVDGSLTNLPPVQSRYYRVVAYPTNPPPPTNMVFIPAAAYTMGNSFNPADGNTNELPTHSVSIGAMYMDRHEISQAVWNEVYNWAVTNGYAFNNTATAKGTNHPIHSVSWYDALKWCNARSEMEGRAPAYYTEATQTTVYRTGTVDIESTWVRWDAGYRLPTEAEWEKAARGGASGQRFPWTDTNTITHARANYFSSALVAYDVSPTRQYHPTYNDAISPYTSPVGSFATNGFGLHDVVGNVWEWCWDRYQAGYYSSSPSSDPKGPDIGSLRVYRGGGWAQLAAYGRVASRGFLDPYVADITVGFRTVLPGTGP